MSQCIATLKVCQGASELHDYAFNLTDAFANTRQLNTAYALGAVTRPGTTGREYISSGGVSGVEDVEWPEDDGDSVEDGSLVWTAQAISYSSLIHRVGTVEWTAPASITISDPSEIDQPAHQEVRISATGGVAGRKYRIVGLVTTLAGDEKFEVRVDLKIE